MTVKVSKSFKINKSSDSLAFLWYGKVNEVDIHDIYDKNIFKIFLGFHNSHIQMCGEKFVIAWLHHMTPQSFKYVFKVI